MAQQTAMQEAIEYLKLFNLEASAIILEDRFLEKEKEQIKDAYWNGTIDISKEDALAEAEDFYKSYYNI